MPWLSIGVNISRFVMSDGLKKVMALILPIGVRAIFCPGGGGGNPFAQKIVASCPNFYKTVERKLGPCNKIGRTGI